MITAALLLSLAGILARELHSRDLTDLCRGANPGFAASGSQEAWDPQTAKATGEALVRCAGLGFLGGCNASRLATPLSRVRAVCGCHGSLPHGNFA
jgi:hypothetical protein